jgi:IS1 family transposase
MMVLALNCVLWSLPKANPASAVMTAEIRVKDTATKEAARKNFNMKHTLKRRHQQTKLY